MVPRSPQKTTKKNENLRNALEQFNEQIREKGISEDMLKDPMVQSLANSLREKVNYNSDKQHVDTLADVATSRITEYLKALEITRGIAFNDHDKKKRVKTKAMLKDSSSPYSDDKTNEKNEGIMRQKEEERQREIQRKKEEEEERLKEIERKKEEEEERQKEIERKKEEEERQKEIERKKVEEERQQEIERKKDEKRKRDIEKKKEMERQEEENRKKEEEAKLMLKEIQRFRELHKRRQENDEEEEEEEEEEGGEGIIDISEQSSDSDGEEDGDDEEYKPQEGEEEEEEEEEGGKKEKNKQGKGSYTDSLDFKFTKLNKLKLRKRPTSMKSRNTPAAKKIKALTDTEEQEFYLGSLTDDDEPPSPTSSYPEFSSSQN